MSLTKCRRTHLQSCFVRCLSRVSLSGNELANLWFKRMKVGGLLVKSKGCLANSLLSNDCQSYLFYFELRSKLTLIHTIAATTILDSLQFNYDMMNSQSYELF